MTAFWIVGIGVNVVFFGALAWWAMRNWKQGERTKRERDDGRR